MDKKIHSGMMLTVLLMGMLTLTFNIQPAKGATIIVPDHYPTIQAAINAANPGDTIYVYNGTYYENVVVNKTVSLFGETRDNTIMDANGTGTAIKVRANNVNISGFTVTNAASDHAIHDWSAIYLDMRFQHCNISRNILTNSDNGVMVGWRSSNNSLSGNIITNIAVTGIRLEHSSDNVVRGNNITNGGGISLRDSSENNVLTDNIMANSSSGIGLWGSANNTLRGNIMVDNERNFGVGGYSLFDFVNDIDTSNIVDGKPIRYWINMHNAQVPLNAGYVALINCTDITVKICI